MSASAMYRYGGYNLKADHAKLTGGLALGRYNFSDASLKVFNFHKLFRMFNLKVNQGRFKLHVMLQWLQQLWEKLNMEVLEWLVGNWNYRLWLKWEQNINCLLMLQSNKRLIYYMDQDLEEEKSQMMKIWKNKNVMMKKWQKKNKSQKM